MPSSLIASFAADPKDSARLLVYDRKRDKITHAIFKDILDFIPKDTAILLNDTKVIKARIFGKKQSGGKAELLFNSAIKDNKFLVYIKAKVKENSEILFDESLKARVIKLNDDGTRVVEFERNGETLDFIALCELFEKIGHTPLPPYIKREDTKEDERDYQTLFAKKIGAVAAPTASLHFTPKLFEKMSKDFLTSYITLHVGAGTFKPIEAQNITDHFMHKEFFEIPQSTKEIIDSKQKILAIGTTVTRSVEFYVRKNIIRGYNDLFLHPKNPPKRVDFLLTNFHLPKSTLLMLTASFIGLEKSLEIYRAAIEQKYCFFSYGDAMLIL